MTRQIYMRQLVDEFSVTMAIQDCIPAHYKSVFDRLFNRNKTFRELVKAFDFVSGGDVLRSGVFDDDRITQKCFIDAIMSVCGINELNQFADDDVFVTY